MGDKKNLPVIIAIAVVVLGGIGYVAFKKPGGGGSGEAPSNAEALKRSYEQKMQADMARKGKMGVGGGGATMGGYGKQGKMGGYMPGKMPGG